VIFFYESILLSGFLSDIFYSSPFYFLDFSVIFFYESILLSGFTSDIFLNKTFFPKIPSDKNQNLICTKKIQ
jgi:hypothetical protein